MPRRLLKSILLVIGSLLLIEGLSWVLFYFSFHERFSYAGTDQILQQRIAEAAANHPAAPGVETTPIVPHPFLGFVYNPRHNPAGTLAYHTVPVSEWGFLDDKSPLRPASDDEVVVGLFGGSVAFWFSVQGLDAMFEELGKLPEFQGKRFVVVRTALGGSKQPQQLMTLSYLLALGGHFDLVVNLDGFNEVALPPPTLISKGIFPFFPRGWPELLGESGDPELTRLVGRVLYLEDLAGERATHFSQSWLRYSVFANTVWRLLDRDLAGQLAQARVELEAHKPKTAGKQRNYAAIGPKREYPSSAEMYQDLVEMWRRSSLQMNQLCLANRIRYFHFLQPNQYLAGTKPMSASERQTALLSGSSFEKDVPAGYSLMQEAGRNLTLRGVAFSDMTQVFAGMKEPLYIDNCCHFNKDGNRILGHAMGKSIAAAIEKNRK